MMRDMRPASIDVSVVVPCYNVEATVEQCVRGICQNDRIALEIALVDDGSKDETGRLLEELAAQDERIEVISKENGGYGQAVNTGIANTSGRYVAICEPDDWPGPHMYDDLFEAARAHGYPDVVKSSYWRVITSEDGAERERHNDYYHAIKPAVQPFTLADAPQLLRYHPSIWSAIYRRGFLEAAGIRMVEAPGAGWVDNPFSAETLAKAASIVYVDEPYYHYREDLPGSSSVTLPWRTQLARWMEMADILEREGISDRAIWQALYVVGFRYVELVLERNPEDLEAREAVRAIFERMDPELIRTLDGVSPKLRELAFQLRGEEAPDLDKLAYARSLVGAGLHSLSINGPAFTASYVGRYARELKERLKLR